ncbi:MAG: (d)CMP kinase [Hyphomicrobiaceae bacterium]
MIIAIDGPAASGKGTLARRIAAHFGYQCLDTGLLYRAVARDLRAAKQPLDNVEAAEWAARSLDPSSLDDAGLRHPGVGEAASVVAKIPQVRAALLDFQRDFAAQEPGAVLDGRDIGTVVCPNADVKLFINADVEVRARRRFEELKARGEPVTYERVLETIKARDARDSGRANAPMSIAADALLLDTTKLSVDDAFAEALALIGTRM